MVMVNKWVLKELPDMPIFFLWLQLLVAVVLLMLSHVLGVINLSPSSYLPVNSTVTIPSISSLKLRATWPEFSIDKARRLWPLIAVNTIGLALNTMCLKYIDASMYQVARSLILPFTVVFQYVFLRKPSSMAVLLCCAVIFAGFLTGLFGDGSNPQALIGEIKGEDDDDDDDDNPASTGASMSGIIFGVLSSLSTALHAVVIKSSLEAVQGNTLELVWYNNVLTAVALAPLVLAAGEYDQIQTLLFPPEDDPAYWNGSSYALWHTLCIGTLVTGFFGFLINLAGFLQIKVTSPVTHMISSAVRGVLQTIIAVWIFSEVLTAPRVLGILFILTGSAFYTFVKSTG